MAARRRSSQTIYDSLFCSVVVVAPIALSLAYYRNDLRQLLRIVFLTLVLIGTLLTLRHSLRRARRRMRGWWTSEKKDEDVLTQRSDLDQARSNVLAQAQLTHNEKAKDFECRVAGPRRERKLEETERKMRHIRGFGDEGNIVGGGPSQGAHGRGVSRLLQYQSESVAGSHDDHVNESSDREGNHQSDQTAESHDDHMTGDDIVSEGDQSGKLVWVAVRLPDRTIRNQFYTSQTVKMLYKWLEKQGHRTRRHVLSTPPPRQLLNDRGCTLEECGITMDTRLVLEESED